MLFLFANTVCEHINGNNQERDNTRAELVHIMANYIRREKKPLQSYYLKRIRLFLKSL